MMNPGKSNRLHIALLTALLASAALVGCNKKQEPVPMPPVAGAPLPTPATPKVAPVMVTAVDLGNAIGPDLHVTAPMTTFAPTDTIYATVNTGTTDPAASIASKLGARWTHVDSNQAVHEETRDIALAGDGVTDFQISKPDGWPTGRYKVEIMLDGAVVQTREFQVR